MENRVESLCNSRSQMTFRKRFLHGVTWPDQKRSHRILVTLLQLLKKGQGPNLKQTIDPWFDRKYHAFGCPATLIKLKIFEFTLGVFTPSSTPRVPPMSLGPTVNWRTLARSFSRSKIWGPEVAFLKRMSKIVSFVWR